MKLNRLTSIALVGFPLALVSTQLVAQTSQLQFTQDKDLKIKVKDDRVAVRDKSKPVRRALEEQYVKIAEAQRNEDIEALRLIRTPDFTAVLPNGQTWNLETYLNYARAGFAQVESNVSISNTIDTIDLHGDEAVAVVHQHWVRMQMKAGKMRRVDTSTIQTEAWMNTKDGWKLKRVSDVKPQAWYVDGKRIDPSKPYDPDAPEYKPE